MNTNLAFYAKTGYRIAVSTAAALLVGSIGTFAGMPTAAQAVSPVIQNAAAPMPKRHSLPVWTHAADRVHAVVNGNTVYYSFDSELLAADTSTGAIKWSYPLKLATPVVTVNQSLYALTQTGTIVKLDARTGKALWIKKAPGKSTNPSGFYKPKGLIVYGTTLYLSDLRGLTQISAVNGKVVRSFPEFEGWLQGVRGNAVFALSVQSGATLREMMQAFDTRYAAGNYSRIRKIDRELCG